MYNQRHQSETCLPYSPDLIPRPEGLGLWLPLIKRDTVKICRRRLFVCFRATVGIALILFYFLSHSVNSSHRKLIEHTLIGDIRERPVARCIQVLLVSIMIMTEKI